MIKSHILTAKFMNENGKRAAENRLFTGTDKQARDAAMEYRAELIGKGLQHVRVEIWEVTKTTYKGTVRG